MADNLIHHEQILAHATSLVSCPTSTTSDWHDSQQTVPIPPQLQMPAHSFQQIHTGDPSPSVFSSPTDSSPSGSPYHPEQRRRNSTFPLFLAQHTPVTPISIDPLEHRAQGMSSAFNPYLSSPPSASNDTGHVAPPYLQSPTAHYSYPPSMHDYGHHGQFGVAGVGIRRRRVSMLATPYPYQHQYSHTHEAPEGSYAVVVGSYEPYRPMEESVRMDHYSPESPEALWHRKDHYSHYNQSSFHSAPAQPQLLLANAMPTSAPIVIDDPNLATPRGSIVRHESGYEYPSQSPSTSAYGPSTSAFAPNVSVISTPSMHTAAHVYSNGQQGLQTTVGGGYSNGTNMDIYANQTTSSSIVSNGGSFTAQPEVDGSLPPIMHGTAQPSPPTSADAQGSLCSQEGSGAGYASNPPVRIITEETHNPVGSNAVNMHEQQQYIPKEEEAGKEDRHLSPIVSDGSEIALPRSVNGGDTKQDRHNGDNSSDSDPASPGFRTPNDGSESSSLTNRRINHQPSDASTDFEAESNATDVKEQIKDVAVASLQHSTVLSSKGNGRSEKAGIDPLQVGRGNANGAAHLPNSLSGGVNRAGSTIKSPEPNETKPLPPPTRLTTATNQDTTKFPDAATTSDSAYSPADIDRPYSPPRHPYSPPHHSEMQAISTHPYHHQHGGSDAHNYSASSAYSFPARTGAAYSSNSYNAHIPAVPSHLRPEWRRSSYSEYPPAVQHPEREAILSNFSRQPSLSTESGSNCRSHSPTPTAMAHRHSLPNLPFKSEPLPAVSLTSPHASPALATGYHTPGGRLVPAAFNNATPSRGSVSSASSTPPTALLDASSGSVPLYRYEQGPSSQPPPHSGQAATVYGSPSDQKGGHYEHSYSSFQPQAAPNVSYSQTRGHEPVYYQSYPNDIAYNSQGANYSRHFDSRARGPSSPAPPMIAGSKRGREGESFAEDDEDRDARRRRSSVAQSQAMIAGMHSSNHSVSTPPSTRPAEMGVIRVSNFTPNLKEMQIGSSADAFSPVQDRMGNGRRAGDGAIRSGSDTSYSFIALPGNTVRKRPRRKFEEITRNYACNWAGCVKAYGTLNHLNAHVTMQKHGPKRVPAEFKELRKIWRKQKREQTQREAMRHNNGEIFHDDDRDDEDDKDSIYMH